MAEEKFTFQAEVSKLLEIVAHSLYSHKEIFLRELISNASDACDKLRYAALTESGLIEGGGDFRIELSFDKKAKTVTVADNGVGMNRGDLAEMLGTIARSGTRAFVEGLSGDSEKDVNLIGQFGVGFYASFMVADSIEVVSRKAGEKEAWLWTSDGKGEFTIVEATRPGRGTTVTLHLAKGEKEFLEKLCLERIVKTYSDHISIPIVLKEGDVEETLNDASALWTRPKKEITGDQYKEFYHHVGHVFDDPWLILHNQVEGVLSYANLLFIPSTPPFDLFQAERKSQVKLYVKRVFITDDCEGLVPAYLRFLRGIVDSEDLPLNISREMFQHDPRLAKIRSGLTNRVFSELKKKAEKKPDEYKTFWDNFGAVFKEGIYEDHKNRDKVIALSRFYSTKSADRPISLDDYVGRMKDGQEAIFYITGEDKVTVADSPQLEGFRDKGVEVLLLTDPIDEFWVPAVGAHQDKPFKSATQGGADLSKVAAATEDSEEGGEKDKKKKGRKEAAPDLSALVAAFKAALGETVKDVRASERLTDSPVCLVADEGDMDMHMERLLKQHRRLDASMASARILEVNPSHPLIGRLAKMAKDGGASEGDIGNAAHLLLDQARIVEGEALPDPAAFSRRLAAMMEKGLVA